MANVETYLWDVTDHLNTKEDMAAYLEAALEDGDPALVVAALNDIIQAKGIAKLSQELGLGGDTLATFTRTGESLDILTALKIIQILGLRLKAIAT